MVILTVLLAIIALILLLVFGFSFGTVTIGLVLGCIILALWVRHLGYQLLAKLMGLSIVTFLLSVLVVSGLILKEANANDQLEAVQFAVVLGAGLEGEQVSKTLKRRLDSAIEVLQTNSHLQVVVSGGKSLGASISEAEAMSRYLVSEGISTERIILEDTSTNTEENLSFSKSIIAHEIDDSGMPTIAIITSDYHMLRAKMIAKQLHLEPVGVSSKTPTTIRINYMLREYFAVIKTWVS
ncbi:YdcF family protein [Paenibacillus daejeonensis]|uniref:YdcF family protein n=1 Tax=Paenibacillus daejeonensis TaxID=135193 RepID=UPI000362FA40|nr:YdcF family protein [Paenibacillus daejeonensis]